jgi:hypothetical protein
MASNGTTFVVDDGISVWFQGPEWDEVAAEALRQSAPELENLARVNAGWEDRTGQARAGIRAEVANTGGAVTLFLYHTVEYGLWLETIQNGRFATLMPTLEQNANRVFADATRAVANARSGVDY